MSDIDMEEAKLLALKHKKDHPSLAETDCMDCWFYSENIRRWEEERTDRGGAAAKDK